MIDCVFASYKLPRAVYVDNTIAAGMSYGYISTLQAEDPDYRKTYLFVIAQESCMTMSIVRFTKGRMELVYTISKECYDCRALCMKLVKRFLDKSNKEHAETILENKVLRAKLIKSMEKSMNYLCTIEESDSISIKMEFLNDENDEAIYKENDVLTGEDVQKCLNDLYSEIVGYLTKEFAEVSKSE